MPAARHGIFGAPPAGWKPSKTLLLSSGSWKASATQVAQLLTTFYATRYPPETQNQNLIRITSDAPTNTVFVQASPADLDEIRHLIQLVDTTESKAVNELLTSIKRAGASIILTYFALRAAKLLR